MSIQTVLFDLDGTLLPMDQEVFIDAYFKGLASSLAPHGYEAKTLIEAVWNGTLSMLKNDGSKTNEKTFWEAFSALLGEGIVKDAPLLDHFYQNDFDHIQSVCDHSPKAVDTVRAIKASGRSLGLATNPLFPSIAVEKRLAWAGLSLSEFDLFTSYENSHYCKPSINYYEEILNRLKVDPNTCLMVGNDVGDDMVARDVGMEVFLLTDCLINKDQVDINQFPHGSFEDLLSYLNL